MVAGVTDLRITESLWNYSLSRMIVTQVQKYSLPYGVGLSDSLKFNLYSFLG